MKVRAQTGGPRLAIEMFDSDMDVVAQTGGYWSSRVERGLTRKEVVNFSANHHLLHAAIVKMADAMLKGFQREQRKRKRQLARVPSAARS